MPAIEICTGNDGFGPTWAMSEPEFNDLIELYYSVQDNGRRHLHVSVSEEANGGSSAVIILDKLRATALRDQLTRMIEDM